MTSSAKSVEVVTRRLRVLFLTRWYPTEEKPAKALFVREHAHAASTHNEVVVLHLAGPRHDLRTRYAVAEDTSRLCQGIPTVRVWYRTPMGPAEWPRLMRSALKGYRVATRTWDPDVIHAHEFWAGLPAALIARRENLPVLVTEHSTAFPRRALSLSARLQARLAFRLAHMVLPVSPFLERAIREHGMRGNFHVVPNTVDTELFRPAGAKPVHGRFRITVVSRLNELKGIPVLIEACRLLARQRQDWHLDLMGDGPQRESYERQIRELGLDGRVTFHGIVSRGEVAERMRKAHLHVVPSNQETFSVVAAEALASGTPVVATVSGGPEGFIHDHVGVLVSPGDPQQLAMAISRVLDESDRYQPELLAEYARRLFSHDSVAETLSGLYRQVCRIS